ncbi:hypothetical protein [Streptomyces sp. NPDC095613]|uniref:hypothetical protein n=1 Tax=Streptomyces sp. NPDC095613 TaxID=3155540 RepID=UPI0033271A66
MPDESAIRVQGPHRWDQLGEDRKRCTACGVLATAWHDPRARYGIKEGTDWLAPDGRNWFTTPGGSTKPPPCPLPVVEAVCPWRPDAWMYDGIWKDQQLDAAMRTWCDTHEGAVSDCPEPGPYCPGEPAHDDAGPGPCTGRENTCRCMCPACCGDTPDIWGYDGDY